MMRSEKRGARSEVGGRGVSRLRCGMLLAVLLALAIGGGAAPLEAQAGSESIRSPHSDEAARRAIGLIRSPYCPGLMLEVCPSEQAEMLRDTIRMFAASGMSSEELVEWMVASHGEEWRAVPKRQGKGIWAWLLPPFALIFGAGFVASRMRAMRAPGASREDDSGIDVTSDDRARLDAELEELERLQEQEGSR